MGALAVLSLGLTSCSSEQKVITPPQVIARVYGTSEVRDAMDELRLTVAVQEGKKPWEERKGVGVASKNLKWPVDIPIVPEGGKATFDRFEVVVEAAKDREVLVQARAVTKWFDKGVRILEVWLARCGDNALGFVCEEDAECHGPECETCGDFERGVCLVAGETSADELASFNPDQRPVDLLDPPTIDAGARDASTHDAAPVERDAGGDAQAPETDAGVDECKKNNGGCDEHADCIDMPIGFECMCQGPAYVGNGETCRCAADHEAQSDGSCIGKKGADCMTDDACMSGHCVGGLCCSRACETPGICEDVALAACLGGDTCVYGDAEDGTPCNDDDACTNATCKKGACTMKAPVDCSNDNPCDDDGECDVVLGCLHPYNTDDCSDGDPCTVGDKCESGACTDTSIMDCTSLDMQCSVGMCGAGGNCVAMPLANTTPCDDGDSCTAQDFCTGLGTCMGSGNACGVNATACAEGTPNTCTCMMDFVDDGAGTCVPTMNECDANPCSPNADCNDPSSAVGDVDCECKPGYEGDGTVCMDTDECAGNPCGNGYGTCSQNAPGLGYSCNCDSPYASLEDDEDLAGGPVCACDMEGTFALRTQVAYSVAPASGIEAGTETLYSWSRVTLGKSAAGVRTLTTTSCGDTTMDLCLTTTTSAHAMFTPRTLWDSHPLTTATTYTYANPRAGDPFTTPTLATLFGISLTNPLGAWPAARKDIMGSTNFDGSATNGAQWLDHDGDAKLGVIAYAVPPGGVLTTTAPYYPVQSYGANSVACPRSSGAARYDYQYFPAADGINIREIKRTYRGSRILSSLEGTLSSCDLIQGLIGGPDAGNKMHIDGRVHDCVRVNGGGEAACSSTVVDFFDTATAPTVGTASFILKRIAGANTTCDDIRAMAFP